MDYHKFNFNLIPMPFYFYKPYKRLIRQRLYMNIKYIAMKTHDHT